MIQYLYRLLKISPLFLFLCLTNSMWAQNCATDSIHKQKLSNELYSASWSQFNRQVLDFRESFKSKTTEIISIPIVVHIVHSGQAVGVGSNIEDSLIYDAIDGLNDRFRGRNDSGIDTHIQFALATRDPWGCVTTGITRVHENTFGAGTFDWAMKRATRWPYRDYYNIWVVDKSKIPGHLGYASYPTKYGVADDGTVIASTEMNYYSTTLTHELGHGLNLIHTFEGGCSSDSCHLSGDKICDTSPHGQSYCGIRAPCSDSIFWSNTRYNYMSYCSGKNRFTPNQIERMRATFVYTVRKELLNSRGLDIPFAYNLSVNIDSSMCGDTLMVYVKNLGYSAVDSLTLHWKIANGSIKDSLWHMRINPCETRSMAIVDNFSNYNTPQVGFVVWTSLPNGNIDSFKLNDTARWKTSMKKGVYSVGDVLSDFPRLETIASSLNNYGICGPVVFELNDGQYREPILIDSVIGCNSTNTITFRSQSKNPSKVKIHSVDNVPAFTLNKASDLSFNFLQFEADTVSSYFTALKINNSASNLEFNNCVFTNGSSAVDTRYISVPYKTIKGFKIRNSKFIGGHTALHIKGSSKLAADIIVDSSLFQDLYTAMDFKYISRATLKNNTFKDIGLICIKADQSYGQIRIENNRFIRSPWRILWLTDVDGIASSPISIHNNYFQTDIGSLAIDVRSSSSVYVQNNTFNFKSPVISANTGVKVFGSSDIKIENNLFDLHSGVSILADSFSQVHSDYNSYWLDDTSTAFHKLYYLDQFWIPQELSGWTAFNRNDSHSLQRDVYFLDDSTGDLCIDNLDGAGIKINGVNFDIKGQLRANPPDIGCLEFSGPGYRSNFIEEYALKCSPFEIFADTNLKGFNYLWSDSSTNSSIQVRNTDTFYLTITDTLCGSVFSDTGIYVIPPRLKFNFDELKINCDSNYVILDDSLLNVIWHDSSIGHYYSTSVAQNISFSFTDTFNCKHFSDTAYLDVQSSPIVYIGKDTSIRGGDTLILDAGIVEKGDYYWSNFFTTQKIKIIASSIGSGIYDYSVIVRDSLGCLGYDTIRVSVLRSAQQPFMDKTLIVAYPNPVTQFLHIQQQDVNTIGASNSFGQVFKLNTKQTNTGVIVDFSSVPAGLYHLEILSTHGISTLKIFKLQ